MVLDLLPRNIGALDCAIRILLGTALLGITFFGPQIYFGWIGMGPLLSGIAGYDPFYDFFGFSTCRRSTR